MTRPALVTAATVVALAGALIATFLAVSHGSDAATIVVAPAVIAPAGSEADFKANSAAISYTDTSAGEGNPGQPITQIPAGQDFRVKIILVFHNNGPVQPQPKFKFTLIGPPPGCEFRDEGADGIYEFESDTPVPVSQTFQGFVEIKVRCNEPGTVAWSATASVLPRTSSDPNLANNVAVDTSNENPITVTSGTPTPLPSSVEDTPTPTATATPTPTASGGTCGGDPPPPGCPTVTPTPTPTITYPPPTNFPNAYQDPFFSVRPDGPSGLDPADILRAPGSVTIFTCLQLGLDCDGVDGAGPPIQDDLDALTFANERLGSQVIFFSTDSQSRGIEGSGTHSQSNDANVCQEEGHEYAEFPFGIGNDNVVFFPATALGLIATTCPDQANDDDDMDALAWGNNVQFTENKVYFSLSPNSPTLASLNATSADVLSTEIGGSGPSIYRSAASLGLQSGDDIDGLCLWKVDGEDRFLLTLARNSPTLALIGASPDDLLFPGGSTFRPHIFKHGSRYGLLETDNVDAVKCLDQPPRSPQGDFNCDGNVDAKDALLLILYLAGNAANIPDCPSIGDGPANATVGDLNCDGEVDQQDVLILLLTVGRLPASIPAGCPPIGPPSGT